MSAPTDVHLALQGRPPVFIPPPTWRLVERPGSGQYVESERGALLARLDRRAGCLYLWDKRLGGEVPVRLADLVAMCGTGQIPIPAVGQICPQT